MTTLYHYLKIKFNFTYNKICFKELILLTASFVSTVNCNCTVQLQNDGLLNKIKHLDSGFIKGRNVKQNETVKPHFFFTNGEHVLIS